MIRRRSLLPVVAIVTLAACGDSQKAAVVVRDAWSPAAPPGATVVAVYGEIAASRDDVLLGIATPSAASAQLHATAQVDGMMTMRPVTRLELKAGTPVQLAPGGMHVMLTGLREPMAAGTQIAVTFRFEHAGEVAAMAQVK